MFVDPSGLQVTISKKDYENFIGQVRTIIGNDDFDFVNKTEKGSNFIISEWEECEYEGGSDIGRALLKYTINSKNDVTIKYTPLNDGRASSFNGKIITMRGWGANGFQYGEGEGLAVFIHELTHAYTYNNSYDAKVGNSVIFADINDPKNDGYRAEFSNAYAEATAITVEERFRNEMTESGFFIPGRGTQTTDIIGSNYAYWGWNAIRDPNNEIYGKITGFTPSVSLMQSLYIYYEILKR
jgi:hypothetical protein